MIYRLIVLNGLLNGQRITVDKQPMTLGRQSGCTVCLPDEEVAHQHAIIEHTRDGLTIRDLGTMNRILVNKREVRAAFLKHGDVIELGHTHLLVQAVVQSEVYTEGSAGGKRKGRRWLAVATLALLAGVLVSAYHWKNRRPAPIPESQPAPTPSISPDSALEQADVQEVSEEIQHLRAALADVRRTVQQLSVTQKTEALNPAPASTGPPPVSEAAVTTAPPPSINPAQPQSEALLAQANRELADNHLNQADQLADEIQHTNPDFLPAYELRARVYEKQGLLEKAMGQWLAIIQRSAVTSLYERAVSERMRLLQAEAGPQVSPAPRVKIAALEQYKFRESEDYDEMRILNISLRPESGESAPSPQSIRILVSFFDQDKETQDISLTQAITPKEPLIPEGDWDESGTLNVNATYVVPRSSRSGDVAPVRRQQYCGYVVQLYYGEELQDEEARPRNLLDTLRRVNTEQPPPAGRA